LASRRKGASKSVHFEAFVDTNPSATPRQIALENVPCTRRTTTNVYTILRRSVGISHLVQRIDSDKNPRLCRPHSTLHALQKAKQARIKAEVARIRADGIAEARRQAEIYKAMGRAGDVKVGLIEHILSTRSVPTKHEGSDASKASATKVRVDWEVPGKKKE